MTLDPDGRWRKSSRCGADFDCVEVSADADGVRVRSTAGGPELRYPPAVWHAFCAAVREDRFRR